MSENLIQKDAYGSYEIIVKGQPKKYSFILSAYNAHSFIRKAIESIATQTFDDFELVIVNDGSSDDTLAEIKSSLNTIDNYVLVNQPNIGLTKTLNRAVMLARGEWLVRQDADDTSLPDRLENVDFAIGEECDFYVTKAQVISEKGVVSLCPRDIYLKKGVVTRASLLFGNPFIHGTFVMRRSTFLKYKYNNDFRYAQDYELLLRLLAAGEIIKVLPFATYRFERHSGAIGALRFEAQTVCAREALESNGVSSNKLLVLHDGKISRYFIVLFREIYLGLRNVC